MQLSIGTIVFPIAEKMGRQPNNDFLPKGNSKYQHQDRVE